MKPATRIIFVTLLVIAASLATYALREHARHTAQRRALEEKLATARAAIDRAQREHETAERELATLARMAQEAEAAAAATRAATPPPHSAVTVWDQKVATLRSLLTQFPHWAIPEIGLLSPDEFIFFARDAQLENEEAQRKALRDLRGLAKRKVVQQIHDALHEYVLAHGGRLPSDLRELEQLFKVPLPDGALNRYALTGAAAVSGASRSERLLYERKPVDELYDTRHVLGVSMSVQLETNPAIYVLTRALAAYADANSGRAPTQSAELTPYLEVPLEATTLARNFQAWQNDPASLGLTRTKSVMMFRPIGEPREPAK